MRTTLSLPLALLALAAAGCGSCPPCEAKNAAAPSCPAAASATTAEVPSAPPPTAPTASASAPPTAPPPTPSATAPTPEPPPAGVESLPEVKVDNVGLHIGGGPNDDASKAPFLKAIEKKFDAFRACYAKVDDPAKGGTFGVDLHIARDGGRAQVKQPRTGMKGTGFRDCVVKVFEEVEFEKPKKGLTVISYSLKYSLAK